MSSSVFRLGNMPRRPRRDDFMTGMQTLLYGMIAMTPTVCLSQPSTQQTKGDLELRTHEEDQHSGFPEAFSFLLVNTSTHDVLLPAPSIECEDPTGDGSLRLHVEFTPLDPHQARSGSGCSNERMDHRPIFDRIKSWKTLHPGESLSLTASRERLLYRNDGPGKYEFWAYYFPPAMEPDERQALLAKGIKFPQEIAISNHVILVKSQ
jgi:hypothetical protein